MKKNVKNALIFFDGFCNLCNHSVFFILKYEKEPFYSFSPLTSDFSKEFFNEIYADSLALNTIILYENGVLYYKSDAVLKIAEKLKSPYNFLNYVKFIPKNIRDFVYDFIANNRFRIVSKRNTCLVGDAKFSNRFL